MKKKIAGVVMASVLTVGAGTAVLWTGGCGAQETAADSRDADIAGDEGTKSGEGESGGAESRRTESGGAESGEAESGGAESGGTESGEAESGGTEPGGAESGEASGGAETQPSRKEEDYIPSAFAKWSGILMPSVGEAGFPVFIVDFQDVKFQNSLVKNEVLEEWLFTGQDSVAGYYETASYGRLHLKGDVYYYTAQGKIEEYESYDGLEKLVMEALDSYDEEADFSQYDKNGDNVLDSLVISVPKGGDPDFWWGATHVWGGTPDYTIDDTYIVNYIVNDDQPYGSQKNYFLATLEHELGHCLGLPDYYKYEYEGSDYEGLHGLAGVERMDDSKGDFCQFSKLLLGWLAKDQVQVMPSDEDSKTFYLPPVAEGGCIVIFPRGQEPDFQKEYFVVEYNTSEGLQKGLVGQGGVRVMHAQAELLAYEDGYFDFKYGNFSEYYDTSNEGIRVLKLVKDGMGFSKTGDTITFDNAGGEKGNFGWYTEEGKITDPGFSIQIGEVQEDGCIQVDISWK